MKKDLIYIAETLEKLAESQTPQEISVNLDFESDNKKYQVSANLDFKEIQSVTIFITKQIPEISSRDAKFLGIEDLMEEDS